jgi:hypothetical protein
MLSWWGRGRRVARRRITPRAGLEVLLLDQHESHQDRADGDALFPRAVAKCRTWASLTCSRGRTTTSMRALWCTPARPD